MTNIVLCNGLSYAEYAHVFTVPFSEKTITILSASPCFSEKDLDNADDFIRMNRLGEDVPGYYEDWDYSDAEIQDSVYSPNGGSGPVFDLDIFSNPNTLRLSRADLLTYVSNGEFMQPYLYRGTVYAVTDEWGETYYATEYPAEENAEENAENIDILEGFLPYVAANGYMDRVDLGFYETEADAIEALIDYYCE